MGEIGRGKIVLATFSFLLTLFIAEIVLRIMGAQPGVYNFSKEFKVVDSLLLFKNFTIDEAGIYKFSSLVTDSYPSYFNYEKGILENTQLRQQIAEIDRFDMVYSDFAQLKNRECCSSPIIRYKQWEWDNAGESLLQHVYDSISKFQEQDAWGRAILNYVEHPLNTEGFRSIAFRNDTTTRKKIFIIGDSYVYGMSACPFHASFTDNLLAQGYMLYAAGIPGTDPAQYAAIAEKYIPIINPDLVVMCFYEGNDYMPFDRSCSPQHPLEYLTNAGFYQSSPFGKFMTLHESYNYYKALNTIPNQSLSVLNGIMAKTTITSLLWGALLNVGFVKHEGVAMSKKRLDEMEKKRSPLHTSKHILAFNNACKKNNVRVLYSVIPQKEDGRFPNTYYTTFDSTKAASVFGSIPFIQPKGLIRNKHYSTKDTHFNSIGAGFYSDFLKQQFQICFSEIDTLSISFSK